MAIVTDIPDGTASSDPHVTSARHRKRAAEPSSAADIPLAHPSDLPARSAGTKPLLSPSPSLDGALRQRSASPTPSETENILGQIASQAGSSLAGVAAAGEEEGNFWEQVFDTVILTIPFSFLFLLLDILVHLQYSFRPKIADLASHMFRAVPTLGIITWFTNTRSSHAATVALLMFASTFCGGRMIYLVNKESWGIVTAQAPAMGTVWTLTIVQLPLSRALVCLVLVGIWAWWAGMKLQP